MALMRFSSMSIATSRTLVPTDTETTSFVMISRAVAWGSITVALPVSGLVVLYVTQSFPRTEKVRHVPQARPGGAPTDSIKALEWRADSPSRQTVASVRGERRMFATALAKEVQKIKLKRERILAP
jgi:hypothetical protein